MMLFLILSRYFDSWYFQSIKKLFLSFSSFSLTQVLINGLIRTFSFHELFLFARIFSPFKNFPFLERNSSYFRLQSIWMFSLLTWMNERGKERRKNILSLIEFRTKDGLGTINNIDLYSLHLLSFSFSSFPFLLFLSFLSLPFFSFSSSLFLLLLLIYYSFWSQKIGCETK